jgi:hypothetical protein
MTGVGLAEVLLRTDVDPRAPLMHDACLNRAATVTPALLLATVSCDVLKRTPRVLLQLRDVAAALAPADTDAALVRVSPVTGVPDHPTACPRQPAHPPSVAKRRSYGRKANAPTVSRCGPSRRWDEATGWGFLPIAPSRKSGCPTRGSRVADPWATPMARVRAGGMIVTVLIMISAVAP